MHHMWNGYPDFSGDLIPNFTVLNLQSGTKQLKMLMSLLRTLVEGSEASLALISLRG